MQAGFHDLMTTLQLTWLNDDQVLAEGDNLAAGIDALQYLNKHLSHSLRGLSESENGLVLPSGLATKLTGEIDKMIRYSQRCFASGRNHAIMHMVNYDINRRIHTVPIRTSHRADNDDGSIAIDAVERQDALGRRVQCIRFLSLSVKHSGHGSAIIGLLSRTGLDINQHISRQLRVVNILPRNSRVFELAEIDDVEGLKNMFTHQRASLLDYDEEGDGLLYVCFALSFEELIW